MSKSPTLNNIFMILMNMESFGAFPKDLRVFIFNKKSKKGFNDYSLF
jgi:hypothetical protein